ncbi:hypothetical protein BGX20_002674 [Mortierella sp. AD010]|nr:hypothetical protein BGX20_002674 [Mortierella sp. AD010]
MYEDTEVWEEALFCIDGRGKGSRKYNKGHQKQYKRDLVDGTKKPTPPMWICLARDCHCEASTHGFSTAKRPENYCGYTFRYCGEGCQPLYGQCNGDSPSASVSASPTITVSMVSVTLNSPSPQSPTISVTAITAVTPTVTATTITTLTTTNTTTTTTTTTNPTTIPTTNPTTTSLQTTFQFQPTGKPSGAVSSQEKVVKSTVALVVVFFAGLMMVQ